MRQFKFNIDMDHIRQLWGIPKGKSLIYKNGEVRFAGMLIYQGSALNDNEAKS